MPIIVLLWWILYCTTVQSDLRVSTLNGDYFDLSKPIIENIGYLHDSPIQIPVETSMFLKILNFLEILEKQEPISTSDQELMDLIQVANELSISKMKKYFYHNLYHRFISNPTSSTEKALFQWLIDNHYDTDFFSFLDLSSMNYLAKLDSQFQESITSSLVFSQLLSANLLCEQNIRIRAMAEPDVTLINPTKRCLDHLKSIKEHWFPMDESGWVNIMVTGLEDLSILQDMDILFGVDLRKHSRKRRRPEVFNEWEALQTLKHLKYLCLRSLEISDISFLPEFDFLEVLDLADNQIVDIEPLRRFKSLRQMSIGKNQISSIEPLSSLNHLVYLDASDNLITNVFPLKGARQLIYLDLSHNRIQDLEGLSDLYSLKTLRLILNRIMDIRSLRFLSNLKHLYLCQNSIEDLTVLSSLIRLKSLHINQNQISLLDPLTSLHQLQSLTLNFNDIRNVSPLQTLTQLTYLDLRSNHIENVESLKYLVSLKTLYLNQNNIRNFSPICFLYYLKRLDLNQNYIESIDGVERLRNLKHLRLNENSIEVLPPGIGQLKQLKKLDLSVNRISNIEPLSNLTSLVFLMLQWNTISNANPLTTLDSLKYLNLYGNPLICFSELRGLHLEYFLPWGVDMSGIEKRWEEIDHSNVLVDRNDPFQSARYMLMGKSFYLFYLGTIKFSFSNEQGVDRGGLTKEFLSLTSEFLFNPNNTFYFQLHDDGQYYISKHQNYSEYLTSNYEYIGRLLAMHFLEDVPLAVELKNVFFMLLEDIGLDFTLADLKDFDHDAYSSYLQLRNMSSEEIQSLDLTFVNDEGGPLVKDIPKETIVTRQRLEEYIYYKVNWLIKDRYSPAMKRLRDGFYSIVGPNRWRWKTLRHHFLGSPIINVKDWLTHVEWKGWNLTNNALLDQFENILTSWAIEQRQDLLFRLLKFVTGLNRLPMGGFSQLNPRFTIMKISEANGRDLIPSARTCFNLLEIGAVYTNQTILERQLIYAIENGMHFTFH